jgi:putative acetyltransferase
MLTTMTIDLNDPRFTPWRSGRFMGRFGRLGEGAAHSDKKVCLVATDPAFLIDVLYGLSLREDCYYVKYGTIAREGMYLGRCWFQTDRAAAELCNAFKGHARLMASIQDDTFFQDFRAPTVAAGSCGVWDDWPEHAQDVARVHEEAFGRPDEAAMVASVRAARSATISLVAGLPPEDRVLGWPIVGHVLLSPVTIDGSGDPRGLGLGPLAVLPAHQHHGFGTRLVEEALKRAKLLGYAYVVVLGHPEYYPRFGFVPASRFGLRYEPRVPDDVFMALELEPGALDGVSGVVRYLPAFAES